MKKILVLGSGGYVGTVLTHKLNNSYQIDTIDALWFGCSNSSNLLPEVNVNQHLAIDIRDLKEENFVGYDSVILLAAVSNDPIGKEFEEVTFEINHHASLKLIKLAKQAGVKNFIFASSCSVYGIANEGSKVESDDINPLTAYAKSKALVEEELENLSSNTFKTIAFRFATACGASPRLRLDLVLNDFVASAVLNSKIEILSDGTPWRPLIHVEDMIRAIEWGIENVSNLRSSYTVLNVGSEQWTFTMESLAQKISNSLGGVEIEINPDGKPDPRSYKVDFSAFKSMAPNYQPIKNFDQAVLELKDQILKYVMHNQFRSSNWIRLNILKELIAENKLDRNLRWIK